MSNEKNPRASAATVAEPSELEMHRADYQAIRAAGFHDPGELLDAYKKLQAAQQQAENLARSARVACGMEPMSGFKPQPLGAEFDKVLHDNLSSLYIEDGKQQAKPGADERVAFEAWPKVLGVGRDNEHPRNLVVYLGAAPTDEELRAIHDALRAAQSGQRGAPEQILTERKLTCEAIEGAIAFGYQNTNPPPSDDHWLAPFWKIGRKQSELEQSGQRAGVAEDANLLRDAAEKGLDINQQPQLGCVEVWAGKGDDALVFREYYSGHADREAATKCALKRALAAPTQQQEGGK